MQNILRCLFCLGLLARYGSESVEALEDEDINMNQFLELYKYFLGQGDFDIKARALQVGTLFLMSEWGFYLFCSQSLYCVERHVCKVDIL